MPVATVSRVRREMRLRPGGVDTGRISLALLMSWLFAMINPQGSAVHAWSAESKTPRPARGASAPWTPPAIQVNWPKFHLDMGNSGYNPYETVIGVANVSSLTGTWTYRAGLVRGTPSLWRGVVFVAGTTLQVPTSTAVTALEAATGSIIWTGKIPHSYGSLSGVAYRGGALYIGTADYMFRSLDARTGAKRWAVQLSGIPSDSVPSGGLVYVATDTLGVYALDAATGSEAWASQSFGGVYSGPALADGTLYVGGNDERLHALDGATGSEIWSYLANGPIHASPAVSGGIVDVAAEDPYGDAYLYAIDAQTGSLIWKTTMDDDGPVSSPAVGQGTVYVSADGTIRAFRTTDGTQLWQTPIADTAGSPVVANGVVYVAGGWMDGTFHALDASTGAPLWSFTAGGAVSDPIVANGMVYAGSEDHNLYAFSLPD